MADITIPPPDANGYWHFTYITTDTLDGRWYGGKRSTKRHPLSDSYLGSGNWIKRHPNRKRLKREIVAFYESSADVFTAEAELITLVDVLDNPFCMNECDGGEGMTVEFAKIRSTNPKWVKSHADALRRIHADPVCRAAHLAGVRRNGARPQFRAEASERLTRLWDDPDYRTMMTAAARLRMVTSPISPEHIEKMAAATRGKKRSPEAVAKSAAGLRGGKRTPEARAKMRAAALRREAKKRAENATIAAALVQRPDHFQHVLVFGLEAADYGVCEGRRPRLFGVNPARSATASPSSQAASLPHRG